MLLASFIDSTGSLSCRCFADMGMLSCLSSFLLLRRASICLYNWLREQLSQGFLPEVTSAAVAAAGAVAAQGNPC